MGTWYRTGTVTVSAGSDIVTGAGTAFVGNVRTGDAFNTIGGTPHEVVEVISNTQVRIEPAFTGTPGAGLAYQIVPTQGFGKEVVTALQAASQRYDDAGNGPLLGRFPGGTANEPALADKDNIGTGMFWPAANQLGWSINGIRRALLSSTGLQLDVPLTGTAVQQDRYDTTLNRALLAGAYGWGLEPGTYPREFNFASFGGNPTGVYWYNTADGDQGPTNYGVVLAMNYASSAQMRLAIDSAANDMLFNRMHSDGTESPWNRTFHSNNVLGDVSADLMTSALFKFTETANGEYRRTVDGYLACTRRCAIDVTSTAVQNFDYAYSPVVGALRGASLQHGFAVSPNPALAFSNIKRFNTTGTGWTIQLETAGTPSAGADPEEDALYVTMNGRWRAI
jgi:hypothetical protein